jgi:hypothetical protein
MPDETLRHYSSTTDRARPTVRSPPASTLFMACAFLPAEHPWLTLLRSQLPCDLPPSRSCQPAPVAFGFGTKISDEPLCFATSSPSAKRSALGESSRGAIDQAHLANTFKFERNCTFGSLIIGSFVCSINCRDHVVLEPTLQYCTT